MSDETKVVRCFMDGIDWQEHLAHDGKGTKLYPSEGALLREEKHLAVSGCGIVEVEVRLVRWVKEQDLEKEYRKPL